MPDDHGPAQQIAGAPDAELLAFPDTDERRLRRALRALDTALAEQRQSVAEFRAQLSALKGAVDQLGCSAQGLTVALADAAGEASRAQAAAEQLVATAEAMEQATRH
jgi:septal ring factor EnvC (AmiA/AmiB activator)